MQKFVKRTVRKTKKAYGGARAVYKDVVPRAIRQEIKDAVKSGIMYGSSYASPYVGPSIARKMGRSASKYIGAGEYTLTDAKDAKNILSSSVPTMHAKRESVIIQHREYLRDISSSVSFSMQTLNFNPGLVATFPWASGIAQNFSQYKVLGAVVEYISTSADSLNSTNTALGSVAIAMNYNSTAGAFLNKQQIENEVGSVSGRPSTNLVCAVEVARTQTAQNLYYVRNGALASNQNIQFYDICDICVATVGSQAVAVCGELWINYEIELFKPHLNNLLYSSVPNASLICQAPTNSLPFGTSRSTPQYDNIGITFPTNSTMLIPAGFSGLFSFNYYCAGSSSSITAPTFSWSANASVKLGFAVQPVSVPQNSGVSTCYLYQSTIRIADSALTTTLTVGTGILPTTLLVSYITFNQLNNNVVA